MNILSKRLFSFAIRVIKFLRLLPNTVEFNIVKNQLIRSSTSPGANYQEAQGAISRADFHYKIKIALKEMRESNYWLEIIRSISEIDENKITELNYLSNESIELMNILGSISYKTRKNKV